MRSFAEPMRAIPILDSFGRHREIGYPHRRSLMSVSAQQLATARFPHATRAISVRETHLSLVVLTGDFVYKVKKALELDFIDTTDLEQRRALCEAELRLNRRYAEELYLRVVPIGRESNRLVFDGEGPAVEYAVQMRQFSSDEELQALLESRSVGVEDLTRLAERIADFHRAADVLPHAAAFTGTDSFMRKARENVASVVRKAGLLDATDTAAALEQWTQARLRADIELLRQRERDGCVRECHGDLHTGNIVRWRGELIPFDCIEFDPELRYIDVLSDVAFLVMDLIVRERTDLAFAFLNRYLERTGDYPGASLLPSYLVYRALVRAKVELITLEQTPSSERARATASALLAYAQRTSRSRTPILILMHGASGSGKSWLSTQLLTRQPALRIRSDLERKRLAGQDPFDHNAPADAQIYSLAFNERTYNRLAECARACLRAGLDTIVDAAFLKQDERARFAQLASAEGAGFAILSCHADQATLAERIARRRAARNDPSDATEEVMRQQLRTMEPIAQDEQAHTLAIDTREPNAVEHALAHIARMRAAHAPPQPPP